MFPLSQSERSKQPGSGRVAVDHLKGPIEILVDRKASFEMIKARL
jgi:hypothetical protein